MAFPTGVVLSFNGESPVFPVAVVQVTSNAKAIINLTYKMADVLYITYIDADHTGDVYLELDLSGFDLVEENKKGVLYFRKYVRR